MYELYLAHHGILGQKWGVRRYQNADGSLTAAGRLRYAPDGKGGYRKLSGSERRAAVTAAKKRADALEKARRARAEKVEYEKGKQEALKSGDASKIDKYFNELDMNEQRQAMERMRIKQDFQRMLNSEAQLVSQGESKMDKMMNTVSKVTDWSEKGIRMYNVIAKVNNAFSDNFMPQIGSGESKSEREKRLRKEAEEDRRKRKEEAEKNAADKAEKERQKWLRSASAEDILNNPGKVKLDEWKNVNTMLLAKEKAISYNKDRKEEATKAAEEARIAKAAKEAVDAEVRAASAAAKAERRARAAESRGKTIDEAFYHTEAKRRQAERQARKRMKNSFTSAVSSNYYNLGYNGYGL